MVEVIAGRQHPGSNFTFGDIVLACPVCGRALTYPAGEFRFQAGKVIDLCEGERGPGGRLVRAGHHDLARWAGRDGRPSPRAVRDAGRDPSVTVCRADWDAPGPRGLLTVKAWWMLELLRARCEQQPLVARWLDATGDRPIVERAPWDGYWGAGRDGRGVNALGRLWMKVRDERRAGRLDVPVPGRTPPLR